ncbi:hypothetical protein M9458_039868, partial [Cirrhinus mrigala]
GHSFDVIMFDVDSKDTTLGMSCPPPAFVETSLLKKVYSLLTPRGLFMLNLVKSVLERVQAVFPCVFSRGIEGEVNEVLLDTKLKPFHKHYSRQQKTYRRHCVPAPRMHHV